MLYLLTYDVSTEDAKGRKRLRLIAKTCENYGQRVQKSVFEFQLSDEKFFLLKCAVLKIIDEKADSIRIYKIVEPKENYVEEYGAFTATDYVKDTLLV